MDQLPLFGPPPPRRLAESVAPPSNGTPTSDRAAARVAGRAGTDRLRIYEYLLARGARGATDEEMQIDLDLNPSTQRPRRGELVARFRAVRDSGQTRPTRSGARAVVWVAGSPP